ncbi:MULTISPECIES: UDP-glucose 4-epimerase GalE [unclassified Neptuniibacter]|uniref:UDP-glucose 4-epimerase GalE n=1 Tax=unclassified Neptuniibacter TaxID=2630693 RepID=UPI0025F42CAB|nr:MULTISPECIES: UDP-glucose 4-epimerase GalE [unclassified Neptuniibacter]
MSRNTVLITGGAGYIGSHTTVQLLELGSRVVVLDNLCNSSDEVFNRIEKITGIRPEFVEGDIRDRACLDKIFADYPIDSVIHFAGLKAVGESSQIPLAYYQNNVTGTLVLCEAMASAGVKKLVFSSSATVYGEDAPIPYIETMPRGKTSNPYGTSKSMVEQVLIDLCKSDSEWSVALLRYFNPIGAHPSGLIGEDPKGIPNNLMPFISQVAVGKREELSIFGNDYPTQDGTCERDYLHVMDLADGHLAALNCSGDKGVHIYNLGTGSGTSVLAMVNSFKAVTDVDVPYSFAPRREGDLPAFWADASKAEKELGWTASRTLNEMMEDTWRWQSNNPDGYDL